eukprot:gene11226-2039_t
MKHFFGIRWEAGLPFYVESAKEWYQRLYPTMNSILHIMLKEFGQIPRFFSDGNISYCFLLEDAILYAIVSDEGDTRITLSRQMDIFVYIMHMFIGPQRLARSNPGSIQGALLRTIRGVIRTLVDQCRCTRGMALQALEDVYPIPGPKQSCQHALLDVLNPKRRSKPEAPPVCNTFQASSPPAAHSAGKAISMASLHGAPPLDPGATPRLAFYIVPQHLCPRISPTSAHVMTGCTGDQLMLSLYVESCFRPAGADEEIDETKILDAYFPTPPDYA